MGSKRYIHKHTLSKVFFNIKGTHNRRFEQMKIVIEGIDEWGKRYRKNRWIVSLIPFIVVTMFNNVILCCKYLVWIHDLARFWKKEGKQSFHKNFPEKR